MKTEPIFLQDTSGWSKAAASYLNRGPQPPRLRTYLWTVDHSRRG